MSFAPRGLSLHSPRWFPCKQLLTGNVCLRSFVVYGGDAVISHCIWSAGYSMTQPVQSNTSSLKYRRSFHACQASPKSFACSFVVYGGDALISHCIWSAGYGMTQPVQSYFKPHVQMFDLGRWERRPMMDMIIDATEGDCNELCQAQVRLQTCKCSLISPA